MVVPAPGLFSMITVAPRPLAISCARVRAITSVPPPGAKGTTILTILSGYPAKALSAQNADSKNAASANRADAIFILRLKTMCTRAGLEFVKAPANHALQRNAMRRATNGYDARCTSGDGRRQQRWTSIRSNDKSKRALWGGCHEALAGRTIAVGRAFGLRAAGGARHRIRLDPQSAPAADQHVFRRSVGRLGQFAGTHLRLVTRQHHRTRLRRRGDAIAGIRFERPVRPR